MKTDLETELADAETDLLTLTAQMREANLRLSELRLRAINLRLPETITPLNVLELDVTDVLQSGREDEANEALDALCAANPGLIPDGPNFQTGRYGVWVSLDQGKPLAEQLGLMAIMPRLAIREDGTRRVMVREENLGERGLFALYEQGGVFTFGRVLACDELRSECNSPYLREVLAHIRAVHPARRR